MISTYIKNLNLPYGIDFQDILFFIITILIISLIIGAINKIKLKKEIKQIPGLEINQELIQEIKKINEKLSFFEQRHKDKDLKIQNLINKVKDIQDIKTLKYNPYRDMGVGGKQSFSTGIIDKNGNGIILTNLYSRERTRVLIKEIENFQPKQELAPEEKELLELFRK